MTANKATLVRLLQSKGASPEYRGTILSKFLNAKSEEERTQLIEEVQRDAAGGKSHQTK